MKTFFVSLALSLLAVLQPLPALAADDLSVDFSWQGTARCSDVSPEIRVANVPAGTTAFKVSLTDLDKTSWNHGGGTVPADPSGVIPSGALKAGYNGPCPPSGSHTYRFTVRALDAEGRELAKGSAKKSF